MGAFASHRTRSWRDPCAVHADTFLTLGGARLRQSVGDVLGLGDVHCDEVCPQFGGHIRPAWRTVQQGDRGTRSPQPCGHCAPQSRRTTSHNRRCIRSNLHSLHPFDGDRSRFATAQTNDGHATALVMCFERV